MHDSSFEVLRKKSLPQPTWVYQIKFCSSSPLCFKSNRL